VYCIEQQSSLRQCRYICKLVEQDRIVYIKVSIIVSWSAVARVLLFDWPQNRHKKSKR